MMNILKPIAFDVIHCVSQLFDYYLYAVYTFFGRNDMVKHTSAVLKMNSKVFFNINYLFKNISCSVEKLNVLLAW